MEDPSEKESRCDEGIILRVPPNLAARLRHLIRENAADQLKLSFGEDPGDDQSRMVNVCLDDEERAGTLVELPTIVEAYKEAEMRTLVKCCNVPRMIVVHDGGAEAAKYTDRVANDGLCPITKGIKKRRIKEARRWDPEMLARGEEQLLLHIKAPDEQIVLEGAGGAGAGAGAGPAVSAVGAGGGPGVGMGANRNSGASAPQQRKPMIHAAPPGVYGHSSNASTAGSKRKHSESGQMCVSFKLQGAVVVRKLIPAIALQQQQSVPRFKVKLGGGTAPTEPISAPPVAPVTPAAAAAAGDEEDDDDDDDDDDDGDDNFLASMDAGMATTTSPTRTETGAVVVQGGDATTSVGGGASTAESTVISTPAESTVISTPAVVQLPPEEEAALRALATKVKSLEDQTKAMQAKVAAIPHPVARARVEGTLTQLTATRDATIAEFEEALSKHNLTRETFLAR